MSPITSIDIYNQPPNEGIKQLLPCTTFQLPDLLSVAYIVQLCPSFEGKMGGRNAFLFNAN